MCSRAATRFWCWRAAASPSAGARWRASWAPMSRCSPAPGAAAVDPAAVEERLRRDTGHEIKAVLMVQIDTASGVVNDVQASARRSTPPAIPALLHGRRRRLGRLHALRDGCMGHRRRDVGLAEGPDDARPASPSSPPMRRRMRAHQHATMKTLYWDWTSRMNPLLYMKHCGTPPEHLLFGLRAALDMIFDEGLEAVWKRHALAGRARPRRRCRNGPRARRWPSTSRSRRSARHR
jgi:alanine-glyoxylate transaminase/serine-glyoxylate transaminase/serine-pyruvate transaminase